jgi:heme oxygenase
MFKGMLNKREYLLYLSQQLLIFQTIESIGLPYDSLKRSENVQADIDELKSQGYNPGLILGSTSSYTRYLSSLSAVQILPHVYLNYMAIMFGGQMMKKAVPSTGKMYEFDNMQESIQSIRNVQKDEWAEEVNKGYDFIISLFDELETFCNSGQLKDE